MSELNVRIVQLPPMRVASVRAFSSSPEHDAWEKMEAWAGPKGLLDNPAIHRVFGFNNPDPSPGSPNYGYEFWIVIGPEVQPEGEVRVIEFPGGLYAVTRCLGTPNISSVWGELFRWMEDSKYKFAHHQWLEENVGTYHQPPEKLLMDLYLPISE